MDVPAVRTMVPDFELPNLKGELVHSWRYKQCEPLVLVLCDESSLPVLEAFSEHYSDYRNAGAEVVGICVAPPPSRSLPFQVLIDADGAVMARLASRLPTVLVTDSYGELYSRIEGPWQAGPDHEAILGSLSLIQTQCPECGVPGPPWV